MAAPVIDPDHAIILHTTIVDVDIDPVLASDEDGMLVNTVDYTPTREEQKKLDHRARRVISLYKTPEYSLKFDAEIYKRSTCKALGHPASTLEMGDIDNFGADFRHGFPGPPGSQYFILKEPGVQGRQGDLYKCSPTWDLIFMPDATVQVAYGTGG